MRRELEEFAPTLKTRALLIARSAVVAFCFLQAFITSAWALSSGTEESATQIGLASLETTQANDLEMLFLGRPIELETEVFRPFLTSPHHSENQGSLYRISYEGRSVKVKGNVLEVGSRFTAGQEAMGERSSEENELLKQALGAKGLDLKADWRLARGLMFSSGHELRRYDNPLDEKKGLTSSDTSHSLAMGLGGNSSIKASLVQHRESWDRWSGRPEEERRERKLEFQLGAGGENASGLRLALTSVDVTKGGEVGHEQTSEAHFNYAPGARWRLYADYVSKEADAASALPGRRETTQNIGASLQLAPETQLAAGLKTFSDAEGKTVQESSLGLTAKVGGETSGGKLALEQKLRADGSTAFHRYNFAGGIGRDRNRTNLQWNWQETSGEATDAPLAHASSFHLDRAFGERVKLAIDRRETVTGTMAAPQMLLQSSLELTAGLGPDTDFTTELMAGEGVEGAALGHRRFAFTQEWRKFRVGLEHNTLVEGTEETRFVGGMIESPTGELPDWAKTITTTHEFEDMEQYLLHKDLIGPWPNLGFTGYRFWAGECNRVAQNGKAFGLTHRRIFPGRWQLQFAFEQRPLSKEGATEGLPIPLQRQMIELGRPLLRGLNVRGRYGSKAGLESGDRVQSSMLGLWGKLGSNEQMEGEISHDRGRWEGARVNRTSVSLFYSHRVNEEHHVEIKLGYAWGENIAEGRDRDWRMTLSYGKSI